MKKEERPLKTHNSGYIFFIIFFPPNIFSQMDLINQNIYVLHTFMTIKNRDNSMKCLNFS